MGKIVTVTLNPAVDKTIHLPRLCPGALNRVGRVRRQAAGGSRPGRERSVGLV